MLMLTVVTTIIILHTGVIYNFALVPVVLWLYHIATKLFELQVNIVIT